MTPDEARKHLAESPPWDDPAATTWEDVRAYAVLAKADYKGPPTRPTSEA